MPGAKKSNSVNKLAAEVRALKIASKAVKVVRRAKKASKAGKSGGFFGSIGKSVGSAAGGFLGGLATKALMSVTGMGDYKVHRNSLYVHSLTASPPPVFRSDSHSTRLVHREFIGDVVGSTSLYANVYKLPINPNQSQTFPWLANMAVQFEEYKFHGLIFEYRSTSGSAIASTNAALGTVFMATQYNAYAPDFRDKQTLDAYEFSVSTRPDVSMLHPIECDPKLNEREIYFVDSSQFTAGGDLRLTNMGNFYLSVAGQQAATTIGELWVTYDVEFFKPRMQANSAGASEANSAYYYNSNGTSNTLGPFIVTDLFRAMTLLPDSTTGNALARVRPSLSNFPVRFGSTANGYPNIVFFPPSFRGKMLWLWTIRVGIGSGSGTIPVVGAGTVAPTLTLAPSITLANKSIFNQAITSIADGLAADNSYNTTIAGNSQGIATIYIKYTLFFDGSAAIDPITNNSQASVGVNPNFFSANGSNATNWVIEHEFYPVFL